MKKWVVSAVLYVVILIVGFQIYDQWIADKESSAAPNKSIAHHKENDNLEVEVSSNQHTENDDSGHEHHSSSHPDGSEINAFIQSDGENLTVYLKDKAGNPVDELEVNHEKLLHLIIVDAQLQQYYHVHPERTDKGVFNIKNELPDGFYKAFIDIKPLNFAYKVEPVEFIVGNLSDATIGQELAPDTNLSKMVDGETVNLNISSINAGEQVKLSFDLDQTNLTPYLGAIGHVVILDEYGKQFLHVHPENNQEPIFETTFEKSGIYKIWAEFKQNGTVRAFPFVIEVKE